jgi:FkbM family methyltransferase
VPAVRRRQPPELCFTILRFAATLPVSLRQRYVDVLAPIARSSLVSSNRYGRFGFLVVRERLERVLGIPPVPRQTVLKSGVRIHCDLRDNAQGHAFYFGEYSPDEIAIIRSYVPAGGVFLDVGAHVGLFSLVVAKHVGSGGRVIAVEPAPDTALVLRANVEANHVDDVVEVLELALGEQAGTIALRAGSAPADLGARSVYGPGSAVARVRTAAFDELIRTEEVTLSALHAIKVDVEGAELSVLRGLERTITSYRPRLILVETIELIEKAGASISELHDFMKSLDYRPLPGNAGDARRHRHIFNTAFVPNGPARAPDAANA